NLQVLEIEFLFLRTKHHLTVPAQSVSLPCRLPNIKPAVVVQWTRPDLEPEDVLLFRDEQPDPENQHPSFRKRVELQDRRMKDGDVSLLLSNVRTSDSGKYECRVFQREATVMNRIGDKGQPWRSPTLTGNEPDLLPAMRTRL
uniref:Ig-like domain-containing protein n=1 Tax=Xiphophorus maculatus TaxID=8083 RepID=A0A3B5Q662_XIPMA